MAAWHTDDDLLGRFDLDNISPDALLFQTGYLTIKEVQVQDFEYRYTLGYPNLEVEKHLNADLFVRMTGQDANGLSRLAAVGVTFSEEARNIVGFVVQRDEVAND